MLPEELELGGEEPLVVELRVSVFVSRCFVWLFIYCRRQQRASIVVAVMSVHSPQRYPSCKLLGSGDVLNRFV